MTYTILQLYIKLLGLALGTCFYLNCTYMCLEITYSLLLISQ